MVCEWVCAPWAFHFVYVSFLTALLNLFGNDVVHLMLWHSSCPTPDFSVEHAQKDTRIRFLAVFPAIWRFPKSSIYKWNQMDFPWIFHDINHPFLSISGETLISYHILHPSVDRCWAFHGRVTSGALQCLCQPPFEGERRGSVHLPDVRGSKESCLSFVCSLGSDIFDHFGIILGLKTVSETCHGRFFGKMTSGAPRQRWGINSWWNLRPRSPLPWSHIFQNRRVTRSHAAFWYCDD